MRLLPARSLLLIHAHAARRLRAPPLPSLLQRAAAARTFGTLPRMGDAKQSSIAAFFGGGPAQKRAAAAQATGAEQAGGEGTGAGEEARPAKVLKRLRKVCDASALATGDEAGAAPSPEAGEAAAERGGGAAAAVGAGAAPPDELAAPQDFEDAEVEVQEEEEEEEQEEEAEEAAGPARKPEKKASKKGKGGGGAGDGAHASAAKYAAYDPLKAAEGLWKPGEPVPFLFLARTFEACSETTKRLEIGSALCNTLRSVVAVTPADLLPAVYLSTCSLAPAHESVELGIGDATLIKALAEATGRSEAGVKELYTQHGDLGIVAQACRSTQRTMFPMPPLTVRGVFAALREIAKTEGTKSSDRKRGVIKKLLVSCREVEAGYIMRLLQGKLRIGLAQQTVVCALAHAALLQEAGARGEGLADRLNAAESTLKQVFSECPTWDLIIPALLRHGVAALPATCHFLPGVPIKPMLAKPTHGIAEIIERFAEVEFSCEYKYDGERAQIHVLENGDVRVFSRNLEDNTSKYPDIVSTFKAHLKPGVRSIVIDSEAVAFDRESRKILPFQVLSTRAKKGVAAEDVKVNICLFAFDCLFADGRTLLREPLTERRRLMYACLSEREGELQFAKQHTSRDLEELSTFLDESIAANTEGLIVKTMDATYEPSKRSLNWLKLKKDYLEGCGDSLDLVVIGGWHGRGKRTGVYGAFLLACYDDESETYQTICKVGTGFSEQALTDFAASLTPTVIAAPPAYYVVGEGPNVTPDVWFSPSQVWEIKAADLSISPVHKAATGLVDAAKGIALRFPRLLRVRDDKKPDDATTSAQVADFYRNQKINAPKGPKAEEEEED